jgi:hypothetical protein
VWFQRTAFVWLIAGFAVGALLLGAKGLRWPLHWAQWLALHLELLLAGWLLQFTMGVAYWMLPKHAAGEERGPTAPIVAAYVLLNGGMLIAGIGQLFQAAPSTVATGRLMEFAAVVAFARNAVPRIKPFGAGRAVSSEP